MNNPAIRIRQAKPGDLPELQRMFVDTISSICKDDYSLEQIKVWTASVEDVQRWMDKLSSQYFRIAELKNCIVGFASLENNDYLDFLYVHKDFQRQGIAGKLYSDIERKAMENGAAILYSDVSITAKRFFENKGFSVLEAQAIIRQGVEILNYRMAKEFRRF
jgi:putative acetyltransferase